MSTIFWVSYTILSLHHRDFMTITSQWTWSGCSCISSSKHSLYPQFISYFSSGVLEDRKVLIIFLLPIISLRKANSGLWTLYRYRPRSTWNEEVLNLIFIGVTSYALLFPFYSNSFYIYVSSLYTNKNWILLII